MSGTVKAVAWATVAVVGGVVAYQLVRGGKSLGAAVGNALGTIGELAGGAVDSVVTTVRAAASGAVDAVNPVSDTNIFSQGANAAVNAVTGNKVNTIGGKLADVFQPDPMKVLDQWDTLRNKVLRGTYTLADEAAIADLPKQVTQGFDLEAAQFRATKGYY